jgi:hypothetical protein
MHVGIFKPLWKDKYQNKLLSIIFNYRTVIQLLLAFVIFTQFSHNIFVAQGWKPGFNGGIIRLDELSKRVGGARSSTFGSPSWCIDEYFKSPSAIATNFLLCVKRFFMPANPTKSRYQNNF